MNAVPTKIPLERLRDDIRGVPLTPENNGGFISNYSRGFLVTREKLTRDSIGYINMNILPAFPALEAAVLEMATMLRADIFQCWLGVLGAESGDLNEHEDGKLPGNPVRYHLPITSNRRAYYWDETLGNVHMFPGVWYGPIPYTKRHRVFNNGATPRVHLVTDYLPQ